MSKRRLGPSYHKLFTSTVISNVGDGMSTIAYPWLASAITRNPILISLVVLVQRLPWLVFTLPAGVITDRVDRKRAMVTADFIRFGLTLVVALAVLSKQSGLPGPDELAGVRGTETGLYVVVLLATLLLGTAEVLRDNCGQTFMPAIVEHDQLEVANGRMWSRRRHRQPVRRPTTRIIATARRLRPPLLRRRRLVLRRRSTRRIHPRQLPRRTTGGARAGTLAQRAGRGLPLAVGQRPAAVDGHHPRADEHGVDAQWRRCWCCTPRRS